MAILLEIVTPEKAVLHEEVDEVILPGTDGELGILPGHLPLMTTLRSGRLVTIKGGAQRVFVTHGGFAEVLPEKVVVLTDASEDLSSIDPARARAALEKAEKALAEAEARGQEAGDPEAAEVHKRAMERARARLIASEGEKR